MNTVKIYGGLGNQLFQYAFGKCMTLNGIEVCYYTPFKKIHKREPFRTYLLDKFKVVVPKGNEMGQRTLRDADFDPSMVLMNNTNFFGYWQRLDLYKKIMSILREEICVKEKFYTPEFLSLKEIITNTDSVSIHIRRGDYLVNEAFNVLPLSYYLTALSMTKEPIFVFSDDIKWCKETLKEDYFSRELTFVQLNDYLDFELMRFCKTNIIANSTYSLWPALLNDNENKKVICPVRWRVKREDQDRFIQELNLPKEWIKL